MAKSIGPVRLKRASPCTLLLGAILCIFIVTFLLVPSGTTSQTARYTVETARHHLSPPTLPYRKQSLASGERPRPPPVVHYQMNNVTITKNPLENEEKILILTPMARFYPQYWENLLRLSYPHELITLGFILPKTREGNAATLALQKQIQKTQKTGPEKERFKSIIILRQDIDPSLASQDEKERHKMSNQKARRAVMAKARNSLLFTTLGPSTSWVLWLDSDIVESPPTLIQDMTRHDKAVLSANCFQKYYDKEAKKYKQRPYDFNNWQDSDVALQMAEDMDPDDILLEGYAEMATYRSLMAYMASENGDLDALVPLDGVGGTALMVKAEVHRDGAMFPPFSFYNLIETEGFAKMAKRLSHQPYGLPNYKVYHYNE